MGAAADAEYSHLRQLLFCRQPGGPAGLRLSEKPLPGQLAHQRFEFGDPFILAAGPVLQRTDLTGLALHFADQGMTAHPGIGTVLAKLQAEADIDHILPVAESPACRNHGPVIRPVKSAHSHGIGIPVVAVAHGKIPLVLGIEVLGMQRSQCCRSGTDLTDPRIQTADTVIQTGNPFRIGLDALLHLIELSAVHGIPGSFRNLSIRDIDDLVILHVDAFILDDRSALVDGKTAGYGCYVLSNAGTRFWRQKDRIPSFPLMDGWVVSAFERIMKPDPAIYLVLCERYGLNPASCLFVDDNADNVAGARVAGMQAHQFTSAQELEGYLRELGLRF